MSILRSRYLVVQFANIHLTSDNIIYWPEGEKVRDVLLGKKQISELGCN
ncbi:hypothetical protein SAMN04488029_2477 [Reichenbachiella faecimaris]|uniref:Uncharacterized protein n=1 Tax=Reichenbachiella faecimaris TaxID=692418 RepID=A0A1W2GG94_REIFA|nr:hypothetical protein SAMN04488029_2477 [Reichenbachiella faecimaris]